MEELDLKRFAKLAIERKVFIIVITILAVIFGIFYSYFFVVPKYKSKTTLLLAQINEIDVNKNTIKQSDITDLSMTSTLLEPYISIIKSDKVLNKVIKNLELNKTPDEIRTILTVTEENPAMLGITIISENAKFAARVANEIAKVFAEESQEIFNITNVNIIDNAKVEDKPYNINHVKDIAIFFLLGIFISSGVIFLIYMLDTTIKEVEDIEQELKLPVFGVIPTYMKNYEKSSYGELIINENAKSPISEAFRTLRTNITFSQNTRTILVTSSGMGDGKTYIVSNLAVAIAKTDKKVLIIDIDMRKGRQHKIFGLEENIGLSNYLANSSDDRIDINEVTSYIQATRIHNLHVMTSGTKPSNPAELLIPKKIEAMLSVFTKIYDIIILDGSPSNIIADSMAVAKFVDYTLLVTTYKTTKIDDAKRIIKNFEQVGGKIKGAILNKYSLTKEEYKSSYYNENESEVRLLESKCEEIKSVKSFIDDAKLENEIFTINEHLKNEINFDNKYNANDSINNKLLVTDNDISMQLKIQKLDDDISAMKTALMQMAMNNGKSIDERDIKLIRYDIRNLRTSLEEVKSLADIDELKKEIQATKEVTEALLEAQKYNNDKIKNFVENYYKVDNKKNNLKPERTIQGFKKQI